MIDITGMNKAEVLMALYHGSHPQGLSIFNVPDHPVTIFDCRDAINELTKRGRNLYFDYWKGHILKVDITGDFFNEVFYDRDNYSGAAADAIEKLRREKYNNE